MYVLYFVDFASVYSIANKRSQQLNVLIHGVACNGVVVNGRFCSLTRVKVPILLGLECLSGCELTSWHGDTSCSGGEYEEVLFMTVVVSIAFVLTEQGSCNVQPKIAEHKIAK